MARQCPYPIGTEHVIYPDHRKSIRFQEYSDVLDGYLYPNKQFSDRPLIGQVFKLEYAQQAFFDTVCTLINSTFTAGHLQQKCAQWQQLVADAYLEDPNKLNSYADFKRGLTDWHLDNLGIGKSSYALRFRYRGIFDFIRRQQEWAQHQLRGWDYTCTLPEIPANTPLHIYPNPSSGAFWLENAEKEGDFCQIRLYHTTGGLAQVVPFQWYSGLIRVQAHDLPNGIYWVQKISADGRSGIAKWVKVAL